MFKSILVAVDLADTSSPHLALNAALDMARKFDGRIHLITVVPGFGESVVGQYFSPDAEKKAVEETHQQLHAFAEEHIDEALRDTCVVGNGSIYQEILDAADRLEVDLIVIGSHRPAMKDYLVGPNAARVVRHAETNVLVVRY